MELIRNKWVLGLTAAGLTLILISVMLFVFVPWLFRHGQPARQPIAFSHVTHVQVAGAQCSFCHRGAQTAAAAGIPSVEQCIFCHSTIGKDNPEIQKVRNAYQDSKPIDWMRVYRLPDSVHFVHAPHLRAGLDCATCHGDVGAMSVVKPYRSLEMGDCLGCHRTRGGPTECSFCHY